MGNHLPARVFKAAFSFLDDSFEFSLFLKLLPFCSGGPFCGSVWVLAFLFWLGGRGFLRVGGGSFFVVGRGFSIFWQRRLSFCCHYLWLFWRVRGRGFGVKLGLQGLEFARHLFWFGFFCFGSKFDVPCLQEGLAGVGGHFLHNFFEDRARGWFFSDQGFYDSDGLSLEVILEVTFNFRTRLCFQQARLGRGRRWSWGRRPCKRRPRSRF